MAQINLVVTRGYGNGTLSGDIDEVPTRGYVRAGFVPIVNRDDRHSHPLAWPMAWSLARRLPDHGPFRN